MNKIEVEIEAIEREGDFLFVTMRKGERNFYSLFLLDQEECPSFLKKGNRVYMVFKESETAVSTKRCELSFRNLFYGQVIDIQRSKIMALLKVDTQEGEISSIITLKSLRELDIALGSGVYIYVKSGEVSIMEC